MSNEKPEWFAMLDDATVEIMGRIAGAVAENTMALQVKSAPMLAHWFVLDTLLLANQANRDGQHANALILMRQCIEAISVVELGICGHPEAEETLIKWEASKLSVGKLRAWLQEKVWLRYGAGLWSEPWFAFMREFAAAVQPYAHYGPELAQWQLRLLGADPTPGADGLLRMAVQIAPRAYDVQKANRITLFHGLLTFTLGRIWLAANPSDLEFAALMSRLGAALGRSRYLDGHQTNWSQQFWAMTWDTKGRTVLE